MAHGLQIRNANGDLILDTTTVDTYYLGSATTGTSNGSITDANINGRKVWICPSGFTGSYSFWSFPSYCEFSVSGNTISWQHKNSVIVPSGGSYTNVNWSFFYGVYDDG